MTQSRPLVVDLDDTLICTDLLVEAACRLLATRPAACLLLPFWLVGGKAALKNRLADRVALDPASLPYNAPLLEKLRAEKAAGRPLYLASASPRKFVEAVTAHLDLFDGFFATEARNLSGVAKARMLAEYFGENGFDYAGNAVVDFHVWRRAGQAIAVNVRGGVARRFRKEYPLGEIFSVRADETWALLRGLRPHQWLKNFLIFVPMMAGHAVRLDTLVAAVMAFLAFCLGASATYLLNDLVDLPNDRQHRTKRYRPMASGAAPLLAALAAIPLLLVAALTIGACISSRFALVLMGYMAVTLAYSLALKRIALLDVMTLAALYTLRILAGSVATGVAVSYWLLMFSLFLFFCLALVKRYTELQAELQRGGVGARGRGYSVSDLPVLSAMACATGFGAVLIVGLYVNSDTVRTLYHCPNILWLMCPLMFYWIGRVLILAHRGEMHDDPVVFAATDRQSLAVGVLVVATAIAATLF